MGRQIKELYEGTHEEELFISFIKELEKNYDYSPYGVGKALAFLYNNLSEFRRTNNGN